MNDETYYLNTPRNTDSSMRLFRFVLLGVVILFILFGAYSLFSYISEGIIIVKTAGNNSISASITNGLSSTPSKPIRLEADKPQKVQPGSYVLSVGSGINSTRQVIVVKSFSTTTTTVSLRNSLIPVEPVASVAANQLSASANSLSFVDPNNNNLETINNNQLASFNPNRSFESVVWSNPNYGIAKTFGGNFYTINNGSIHKLNLPEYIKIGGFNYTLSSNQTAYFVNKSGVYSYTNSGGIKQVYKNGHYPASISASSKYISVSWPSGSQNKVIIISSGGSLIYKGTSPAAGFVWSTKSNLVAVFGESYGGVFNSSMQELALIPNINIVDPIWVNNNTLVFASGNKIWSYDLKKKQSTVIAASKHNIQSLILSSGGSYVYFTAQPATLASSIIYRIGLKNQSVSQTAIQLNQHLPVVLGFCRLGYVNFTSTQLLIQSFVSPTPSVCDNTPNYLSQYGINGLGVQNSSVIANKY